MQLVCLGFLVAFKCTQVATPAPVDVTFCDAASPLRWSSTDSRPTKEQADAHNKVGKALKCPQFVNPNPWAKK